MANAAELLKLITARSKSFSYIPGGKPVLTPEDVMSALAYIPHKGAGLLLRIKYADQKFLVRDLDIIVWLSVVDMWMKNEWPYPKKKKGEPFRRNMGRLAIIEVLAPDICMPCKGEGKGLGIKDGKAQIITCKKCAGTGRKPFREAERARAVGMNPTAWDNTWKDKYHDILAMVREWESLAIGIATKKIREIITG